MSDSLRYQTMALLGQDFLLQALVNGGSLNSVFAEALLQPRTATTGREKTAAALTGRIRGDSAMLRQGAKNVGEAASMAEIVKNAATFVAETLNAMKGVIQDVQDGTMTQAAAEPVYDSLVSQLAATIEGAQYNGISLLDGTKWAGDERLTASGRTAALSIQVGGAASAFSLRDISDMKTAFSRATVLADPATALDNIDTALATATTMASSYESLAGSYTGEARYLERQAETLTQAALQARPGWSAPPDGGDEDVERSVGSILFDLLLRDQGSIVDTSS